MKTLKVEVSEGVFEEVAGRVYRAGLFGIHRPLYGAGAKSTTRWTITHEPSGRALCTNEWPLRDAQAFARQLDAPEWATITPGDQTGASYEACLDQYRHVRDGDLPSAVPLEIVAGPKRHPFLGLDEMDGYCINCGEDYLGGIETDARKYPCSACHQATVYGSGSLLEMGLVE